MKESVERRAAASFGIPPEGMSDAPRITISGDSRVLIEGLRALEDFGETAVVASVRRGRVTVRGDKLRLDAMSERELSVSGRIREVELG